MADNPLITRSLGGVMGGVMNTAMGAALGATEGASLSIADIPSSGIGMFTGRQVGRLAGAPLGALTYATGAATIQLAKHTPDILHAVGETAVYNARKAKALGKLGAGVFNAATNKVPRGWENMFTGRELKAPVSAALQLGALALAIGTGLKRANDTMHLGTVERDDYKQPDAMSYDGVTVKPPTNMGYMGGTGDLVHAMHANRHG